MSLLPPDSLIAPPHNAQYYSQSQGFGAHLDDYPKEPPNTAMTYNSSAQLRTQSFTSSAYELAMPHFPSLMNPAFNRFPTSVDAPSSVPQIAPSTSPFNLSHHPSSSTTTAPVPHPPLASPLTLDPPKPAAPPGLADTSGAPSSPRAGPAARNASSGVIACRQWCVTSRFVYGSSFHLKSPASAQHIYYIFHSRPVSIVGLAR